MTTVRRALLLTILAVLSVVAAPGIASASSACPRCAGHGDKAGGDYVVRAGDTLSEVAAVHRVRGGAAALYAQNRDVLTDADHIYTGQRLLVGPPAPRVLPVGYRVTIRAGGSTVATLDVGQARGLAVFVVPRPGGRFAVSTASTDARNLTIYDRTNVPVTAVVTRYGVAVRRVPVSPDRQVVISLPTRFG